MQFVATETRVSTTESRISAAFSDVLGERFVSVVAYGSAITGGVVPEFSDLDLALFMRGQLGVRDALALHRRIAEVECAPYAYLQLSYVIDVGREDSRPLFVPGCWRVVAGDILDGWEHTEATLYTRSCVTLAGLFPVLGELAFDWAVATGDRRTRAVRLMATKLKPAVRSLLVRRGWPALEAWKMDWRQLSESWQSFNPAAGKCLDRTIGMLPAGPDEEQAAGELLLTLLSAVAADSVDLQTE
ncbi:hypothetical protein AYO38_11380 [bacterium SCGC AG-212-C10]|nr:hypothetical protein AYO38_11380 [bacterium SCGC AG-212-C10]